MKSHLLVGKVVHRRTRPARHVLEHDVWYVALDVDEIDEVARATRVLRRNRRGLLSFHDRDYMPAPGADVATQVRAHLRSEGIAPDDLGIILITTPRILGYQFNPASFYLCRDAAGALVAVVVEVHNTYGERHLYTLKASEAPSRTSLHGAMNKDFYVSPFIGPDAHYNVSIRDRGEALAIGIGERQDGEPLLATSVDLRRLPLTTRNLIRVMLRYPLVTHKTIALIHWHALRLWLKRVPWHPHEASNDAAASRAATPAGHGTSR